MSFSAVMESFFGTYKQEWAHDHRWSGLIDARAATHDYIDVFYNRQRLHSSLGYRTPAEADEDVA
ncbi:MAG: transposase [bacterium]|nr:transposase [bacterium]